MVDPIYPPTPTQISFFKWRRQSELIGPPAEIDYSHKHNYVTIV